MELEGVISNCKGMPYLLLRIAELLTKGHELWKIVVEKQGGDRLKGTIAHSKAKKGGYNVYVRKDKDHMNLSAMKRHTGNNSGSQLLESIGEEAQSDQKKSKDKTKTQHSGKDKQQQSSQRMSKNAKRKERELCKQSNGNVLSSSFVVNPPSESSTPLYNQDSPLPSFELKPSFYSHATIPSVNRIDE